MQDLNVTLVQANQFWEDKNRNLAHFNGLLSRINVPTDLIVLPEMFHTSFTMNAIELAEPMDGEGVKWLSEKAAEYDSAITASLIIHENDRYYNRMVFVTPEGVQGYYDKRKLFGLAGEDEHFDAGKKNTVVNYKGWKLLLQVCYDLRFPENCRNKIFEGTAEYDAIIYVANWPQKRSSHWIKLLPARAIENQAYVVAVNRMGKDGKNFSYSGDSCVINPTGEFEHHLSEKEGLINAVLQKTELEDLRKDLPFLKDRD
ncbi:MAG: nitrilase-related carbon-nitrogen hydrolase [Brumimicrobium sp.]|nr:nitrilase-related carbon-nitrogen hydrolase [Brumimicrobium sp.]